MKKRLISGLLAFGMVLGMIPAGAFTLPVFASTSTTVAYNRKNPEVAILNAKTGTSSEFYKKLLTEKINDDAKDEDGNEVVRYDKYNAVGLYQDSSGKPRSYSDKVKATGTWTWDGYGSSVLHSLAQVKLSTDVNGVTYNTYNNLEVNISGSFNNHNHKHKKTQYYAYESLYMSLGGAKLALFGSAFAPSNSGRVGDLGGFYLNVDTENAATVADLYQVVKSDTSASQIKFQSNLCDCNKTSVEKILITFRDTKAPKITGVTYVASNDGTNVPTSGYSDSCYLSSSDDYLYIKLTFNEPIRFADDNAEGKEEYYINLQTNGAVSAAFNAYLCKLDGNDLYFRLDNKNTDLDDIEQQVLSISTLNFVTPTSSQFDLVQVAGSSSFALSKEKDGDDGYTTATSLITDLAGNAMTETSVKKGSLYIDHVVPTVENVQSNLTLNNADVKEALGKTGNINSTSYTDNSDRYLGTGDSVQLIAYMSEVIDTTGLSPSDITATTTLKSDGTAVTVQGQEIKTVVRNVTASTSSSGSKATTETETTKTGTKTVTVIYFKPILIDNTMSVTGSNGILVTKVDFKKTVKDLAGNTYESKTIDAAANNSPAQLDVEAPTIGTTQYIYNSETKGFTYKLSNLSDPLSGAVGIYGSFTLNQTGDTERSYQYYYAVTASDTTPTSGWEIGTTGVPQTFMQHENTYIHIKPITDDANVTYYQFENISLSVTLKDYAGNAATLHYPDDSTYFSWYIDSVAPTVTAGDVTRTLNSYSEAEGSVMGNMTVNFSMSDHHGISGWKYAWGDDDTTAPTDWKDGIGTTTNDSTPVAGAVSIDLIYSSNKDTQVHSMYLWVQATDNVSTTESGNTGKNTSDPICLGLYTYDLREANYELKYTTNVSSSANLQVSSLGSSDALIFLMQLQDKNANQIGGSSYYVLVVDGATTSSTGNIFNEGNWKQYGSVSCNNGVYTFTDGSGAPSFAELTNGSFTGNISITVLSGKSAGMVYDAANNLLTSVGEAGVYSFAESTFTLRVAGNTPYLNYKDCRGGISNTYLQGEDWITVTSETTLSNYNGDGIFTEESSTQLSTLAGVVVDLTIDKDNFGWNCEDIDLSKSKVVVKNESTDSEIARVAIGKFIRQSDGTWSQKVILPQADYTTGCYSITFQVVFASNSSTYDVPLIVPTGKVDEYVAYKTIVVDATEPNNEFGITSFVHEVLGNSYNVYQMKDAYEAAGFSEFADGSASIVIPTSSGDALKNSYYAVTISSPNEGAQGTYSQDNWKCYTGQYYLQMWNTADADHKVNFYTGDVDNQTTITTDALKSFLLDTYDGNHTESNYVYLTPDTDNVIAMQKVYANGKTSVVKYITIHPNSEQLTGTVSTDSDKQQLIFTPDQNAASLSIGATVYAFAYQNNNVTNSNGSNLEQSDVNHYYSGAGVRIPMTYYGDNTWRCSLLDGGAMYQVVTITSTGNICESEWISQRGPWLDSSMESQATLGGTGTAVFPDGIQYKDNGNGTYTIEFVVRDDKDAVIKDGITVEVGFNEEYCTDTFRLTCSGTENYHWTATETSNTGIYQVDTYAGNWACDSSSSYYREKNLSYLHVTMTGVMLKNSTDTAQNMTLTVTAKDAYGYTTSDAITKSVTYQKPTLVANNPDTLTEDGLSLTFTQPVRPTESWAWIEEDNEGFSTEWTGAFPVISNGQHTITYVDYAGNTCETTFTTNAFTQGGVDYSVSLDFSETELTKEAVELTATLTEQAENTGAENGIGVLIVEYTGYDYENNTYDDFNVMVPINGDNQSADRKEFPSTPRKVKLENSSYLRVLVNTGKPYNTLGDTMIFRQRVHVENIATEAPEATLYYSFAYTGITYTQAQLEAELEANGGSLTMVGDVRVTYTTSRNVTPTDDTGNTLTFKCDNTEDQKKTHTFKYVDDMGNAGSVEAKLPAGLTLTVPVATIQDTYPPVVSIDLYAKRNSSYHNEANFWAEDTTSANANTDMKQIFAELGVVQGYNLTLNITDDSDFTIAVTGEGSTAIPDGVALYGNIITIDKKASFEVTVTDEESNSTSFIIKSDWLGTFDTTAPTAAITVNQTESSLYQKTLMIQLSDTHNDGTANSGEITLTVPSTAKKTSNSNEYKYTTSTNGIVEFVFYDEAGNKGTASYNVAGVDTTPPKLSVTWSPCYEGYDGNYDEETGDTTYSYVIDTTRPSVQTNTDVTAIITCDKPMQALELQFGYSDEAIIAKDIYLLQNGVSTQNNPYVVQGGDGQAIVTIYAVPERITVTYTENYADTGIRLIATAANGVSSTAFTLDDVLGIDKEAPEVNSEYSTFTELYHRDAAGVNYTVPYAYQVSLVPDDAYSPNYGELEERVLQDESTQLEPVYYNYENPLNLTFTKEGTYQVQLKDHAGNLTVVPITVPYLDNTAPKLTLSNQKELGQSVTIDALVDENCTVTVQAGEKVKGTYSLIANTQQTITLAENGVFAIVATDSAGNQTTKYISVGSVDNQAPSASFTSNTIYLLQDAAQSELTEKLATGYTTWDNMSAVGEITVAHNGATAVNLSQSGLYTVEYTFTDKAGNQLKANRFVQIIGKDTVCIEMDGTLIIPNATAVLEAGTHVMSLRNCNEPYTVKACKGLLSVGQMKYSNENALTFDSNGSFTVTESGYYTLLVTTQSRQTVRILLYVEQ